MEDTVLQVRMLGGFSLTLGERRISDEETRSKKVWLLLAYLLYNHHRSIPQSELIDLFWGDDAGGANPGNALKTTLHRARSFLDQLDPGAGHRMILRKGSGYAWADDVPLWIDIEEFGLCCRTDAGTEADGELERLNRGLSLYRGPFLGKMSGEAWTMPIAAYYQALYIQTVRRAMPLLEAVDRERAVELCGEALQLEPYEEELYQYLMRNLLALGRQQQVASVYEEMSKLLLSNFGVMPDQESRALYREALRTVNSSMIPPGEMREHLQEMGPVNGALLCDFDFFRMIYQAEARMVARSGDTVHVALLTLAGERGADLPRRSLERAMDNLQEMIRSCLRKGDVVSRCSPAQFMVMLPQANYENSCMVCQRIIRAFSRQYPHSPAQINYSVQPLEPIENA